MFGPFYSCVYLNTFCLTDKKSYINRNWNTTGEQRGKGNQSGFSLLKEGKKSLIIRLITFANHLALDLCTGLRFFSFIVFTN